MFVLPMLCPTHMYLIKSQILQTPSLQENHLILLALACHVILMYCSIFPGLGADDNCFSGLLLWRSDFIAQTKRQAIYVLTAKWDNGLVFYLDNQFTTSSEVILCFTPGHNAVARKRCAPFTVHPTLKNYKSLFYIELILVQLSTNDSAVFFQGQVASSCQFQEEFFFSAVMETKLIKPVIFKTILICGAFLTGIWK